MHLVPADLAVESRPEANCGGWVEVQDEVIHQRFYEGRVAAAAIRELYSQGDSAARGSDGRGTSGCNIYRGIEVWAK